MNPARLLAEFEYGLAASDVLGDLADDADTEARLILEARAGRFAEIARWLAEARGLLPE
jgi:hypothetical protein